MITRGLIILIFISSLSLLSAQGSRQTDSLALVAFYNSTDGPNWNNKTNWLSKEPINNWFGLTHFSNKRVHGIRLQNNGLKGGIPAEIGTMDILTELHLSNNEIDSLPKEIGNAKSLRLINLQTNKLKSIPKEIGALNSLSYLYLYSNQLSSVPAELANLTSLKSLSIGKNNLSSFNINMSKMIGLTSLSLDQNQLSSFPSNILDATKLAYLNLYGNKLSTISEDLSKLSRLQTLFLGKNSFNSFPTAVNKLNSLTYLSLQDNPIKTIPSTFTGLTRLLTLNLRNTQLSEFPKGIGSLTNLSSLTLDLNKIDSIPSDIKNLKKLSYLILQQTGLKGINPAIGDLSSLQTLLLNDNKLQELPKVFSKLTKLSVLRLQNNRLSDLPVGLNPAGLRDLIVTKNKLQFDDLERFKDVKQFIYYNQDSVGLAKSFKYNSGDKVSISVNVGGTANYYRWYKDGSPITQYNDTLRISSFSSANAGTYICKVQNRLLGNLVIYTRPIKLTINNDAYKKDSLALVSIYNSMNGSGWKNKTNWLSNKPIGQWFGVTLTNNRVTKLNFYQNNLKGKLPKETGNLNYLQELNLYRCQIDSFPKEFGKLDSLKKLILSNGSLRTIPTVFGELGNLRELHLSWNAVTSIPKEIAKLKNLELIGLTGNQINEIPAEIGQLKALKTLNLSRNKISALPNELFQLKNLEILGLSTNKLKTVSKEIGNLKELKNVILGGNQLTTIPTEIGSLLKLKSLDLQNNQLSSIPKSIGQLKALENLYINRNKLSSLPIEIGALIKLRWLSASNNSLATIPKEISGLKSMYRIDVNFNRLKSIPKEIGSINTLQYIFAYNNELDSIPAEIGNLKNLKRLIVNDNKLKSIPSSIRNIASWEYLFFNNNRLEFDDLLPFLGKTKYEYRYAPQDSVGIEQTISKKLGESFELSVKLAGDDNTYQWYKGTTAINGATSFKYVIAKVSLSDEASYICKIKNTKLSKLTLIKKPVHLKISKEKPLAPENLSATAGDKLVKLRWNRNTQNSFTKYYIYGGTSPNPTTLLDSTVNRLDTVKSIKNLINNTVYYFRLKTVDNEKNLSPFSNEVSARPIAATPLLGATHLYQHPLLNNHLLLSVIANSTLSINPSLVVYSSTSSDTLTVKKVNDSHYESEYKLSADGQYNIRTKYTAANRKSYTEYKRINVKLFSTNTKNLFISDRLLLQVDEYALNEDRYIIYQREEKANEEIHHLSPGLHFNKAAKLELKINESYHDLRKVFVYKHVDGKWEKLSSQVQKTNRTAITYIKEGGTFKVGTDLSFTGNNIIPDQFLLKQNFPNPFNPVTKIQYDLPENSIVNLVIYNALGQKVKTLINSFQYAGINKAVEWNGTNETGAKVSSGIYFYQLRTGNINQTRKMILLK